LPVFILFIFFDFTSLAEQIYRPGTLPAPYAKKSIMNDSKVVGWKNGVKPIAPFVTYGGISGEIRALQTIMRW
jgi:hypothetical protein